MRPAAIILVFATSLALLVFYHGSIVYAAGSSNSCSIAIGSNATYTLSPSCSNATISVLAGINQSKLYCEQGSSISSVVFGNNTYNNTLFNCTFADAHISSMHNAMNNIISPSGSYNTSFIGNRSNLAVGYYFVFVPLGPNGNAAQEGFAAIMPDALVKFNPGVGGSQQTTYEQIVQDAQINNYTLPRFGAHQPGPVGFGNQRFAVEAYAIFKNHTFNYNPYFFICPFWGWDELTFKIMNITSNVNFTPTLVYPRMEENIQFPDNTSIYWNYTVVKYSNATNMTFHFWKGYQVAPDGKIMHVIYNVTSGNYSYERGIQAPGIHETIAVLKSPEAQEQDNSTTETYGVGLAFCTQKEPAISIPGYYTMSQKYLGLLNTFWSTNITCDTALKIVVPKVTINCLGGTINSTNESVYLINGQYTTLENCRIKGNAIDAIDSENISIYNSSIIANNYTNVPFTLYRSSLYLYDTNVTGYSNNAILLNGSSVSYNNTEFNIVTTTISYNTTVTSTIMQSNITTVKASDFAVGLYSHMIELLLIFLFFTLIIAGFYIATSKAMAKSQVKTSRRN
jgi:hypothetical protein